MQIPNDATAAAAVVVVCQSLSPVSLVSIPFRKCCAIDPSAIFVQVADGIQKDFFSTLPVHLYRSDYLFIASGMTVVRRICQSSKFLQVNKRWKAGGSLGDCKLWFGFSWSNLEDLRLNPCLSSFSWYLMDMVSSSCFDGK